MVDLNSVQIVIGKAGQPTAVQVDIELWRQIVAALEDAEDLAAARTALAELEAAGGDPERAGWQSLDDVLRVWEPDDPDA